MTNCFVRISLLFALSVIAGTADAGKVSYRIVAYMDKYDQPAGFVEGSPGVFYGISGSVTHVGFSITTQGLITILATFPSGHNVESLFVAGSNGRLYSTAEFSDDPANMFSVTSAPGSARFYPQPNFVPELTQSLSDGSLLGVGPANTASNAWNLLICGLDGKVTSLYEFSSNERLLASAIYASDGNYYGIAQDMDAPTGYVYRVTPSGLMSTLYSFPSGTFVDYFPAPLLQADDGNLYGAVPTAGANGAGIIYKLTLDGQYTLLYTFPNLNSGGPTALIEGSDGNLYGATLGAFVDGGVGQFFRISKSGQFESLYSLNEPARDGVCMCDMVLGSDGIIYGTTQGGGATGAGAVFALDVGLPKPQPWAKEFGPQSGPAGTRVRIWGSNLLSPSVEFNDVPAVDVAGSGPNYVWATVPEGATTGPITVTTPGGTNTTHASFTVQ
jgi:uncharacterized repeat protein (TIGR03803 family)